jgi:hypothetical protein
MKHAYNVMLAIKMQIMSVTMFISIIHLLEDAVTVVMKQPGNLQDFVSITEKSEMATNFLQRLKIVCEHI